MAVTSSRAGGVSAPPFDALNLGGSVGDDPAAVRENRRRFLASWGIAPERVVVGRQTHSANVAVVGEADAARGDALPDTDALVTNAPGLAIGVFVADCVPLFLYDPIQRAAGVVHAGRVGIAAGVIPVAAHALHAAFGSNPSDVSAIIGPSIGVCCYEVSGEIAEAFSARYGESVVRGRHLDLRRAATVDLERAGLSPSRVTDVRQCAACDAVSFFSHRRDCGRTGRMWSILVLR